MIVSLKSPGEGNKEVASHLTGFLIKLLELNRYKKYQESVEKGIQNDLTAQ